MTLLRRFPNQVLLIAALFLALPATTLRAEEDDGTTEEKPAAAAEPSSTTKSTKEKDKQKRKYMIYDPDRVDAGIFYVGFAAGGNFYIEPQIDTTTKAPNGQYFKDFGFQAGVFFDYDYSALEENIPLALRGMVGYKYILSSVHVFAFDAMVRRMFRFSEKSTFGLGFGASAALWFRPGSLTPPVAAEEIIFLPSLVMGAGFEFNPVMVDFKLLINRIGQDATILGTELYVCVRF